MKSDNKIKYLELYKKWLTLRRLPGESGLCLAFKKEGFDYDTPRDILNLDSDEGDLIGWWGSDSISGEVGKFTSLRQNVVLLLAALNGEFDENTRKRSNRRRRRK